MGNLRILSPLEPEGLGTNPFVATVEPPGSWKDWGKASLWTSPALEKWMVGKHKHSVGPMGGEKKVFLLHQGIWNGRHINGKLRVCLCCGQISLQVFSNTWGREDHSVGRIWPGNNLLSKSAHVLRYFYPLLFEIFHFYGVVAHQNLGFFPWSK